MKPRQYADGNEWEDSDIGKTVKIVRPSSYVDGSNVDANEGRIGVLREFDPERWSARVQFTEGDGDWFFPREVHETAQAALIFGQEAS